MKTRITLCTILFLLAGQSAFAAPGGSGWQGLWKLVQQTENGPVTLYLFLKSERDKPILYSRDWVELPLSESKLEGDSIMVNWQAKGGNLIFQGKRNAEAVAGRWDFFHPQYDLKGKFSAERVFTDTAWTPLGALDALNPNATGLVDLNELLIKAAKDGAFASFWRTEFFPKYYALIGETPPVAELERIVASKGFEERAKAFHESVLQHIQRAKEKTSRLGFKLPILALCFGKETRLVDVGGQVLLIANSEKLSGANTPRGLTHSAEALISAGLGNQLPSGHGLHLDYFRVGVPLYVAAKLVYSTHIEDILQVTPERAEALRRELPDLKKKVISKTALNEEERRFLAYDFTSALGVDTPLEKMVRMSPMAIGEAFRKYIVP